MQYPNYTNIFQICLLPNKDIQSSTDLFDLFDNIHCGIMKRFVLNNQSEWESTMQTLSSECKSKNIIPILHIDMHGCKSGYGRNSIEFISWDRLIKEITNLNKACNGQLFLALNVCYGLELYNNLIGNDFPISYRTLGSCELVNAHQGKRSFFKMYESYFSKYDMNKAISDFFQVPILRGTQVFKLI